MHVHVDQARYEGDARQVDPLGTLGKGVTLAAHPGDPAVGNDHQGAFDAAAGGHVDHPVGGDHDRGGLGGLGGKGGEADEGGSGNEAGGQAHVRLRRKGATYLPRRGPGPTP